MKVNAFVLGSPLIISLLVSKTQAFGSFSSSFTRSSGSFGSKCFSYISDGLNRDMITMYEPGFDAYDLAKQKLRGGFWVALDHTEKWIQSTLKEMPKDAYNFSYECDMSQSVPQSVASIFRRFREARLMGENHERVEMKSSSMDIYYKPDSLRHTSVIILPFCEYFDEFSSFEKVMNAITEARLNSLDFVMNVSKKQSPNWSVSVNEAILHPKFQANSEEVPQRQSPYPTVIMEVASQPQEELILPSQSESTKSIAIGLESVFAKSAMTDKKKKKGDSNSLGGEVSFWDEIGKVNGIEEVSSESLVDLTEDWIFEHESTNLKDAHFCNCYVDHPDAAYEFVFTKLAMFNHVTLSDDVTTRSELIPRERSYVPGHRSYLILPKFLSASATSFEAFARGVDRIVSSIDGLGDRLEVYHFHPEHVDENKRSPAPTLVFQFYEVMQWYGDENHFKG